MDFDTTNSCCETKIPFKDTEFCLRDIQTLLRVHYFDKLIKLNNSYCYDRNDFIDEINYFIEYLKECKSKLESGLIKIDKDKEEINRRINTALLDFHNFAIKEMDKAIIEHSRKKDYNEHLFYYFTEPKYLKDISNFFNSIKYLHNKNINTLFRQKYLHRKHLYIKDKNLYNEDENLYNEDEGFHLQKIFIQNIPLIYQTYLFHDLIFRKQYLFVCYIENINYDWYDFKLFLFGVIVHEVIYIY
jgi:hypothetical protein